MATSIGPVGAGNKRLLQVELVTFYIFAAAAVTSAAAVVLQRRAIYSALSLIICLGSIAVLFFQLGAHFIGAVQVIVYAGAIMVLFLFVVMLLDPESEVFSRNRLRGLTFVGVPSAALFVLVLSTSFGGYGTPAADVAPGGMDQTVAVARHLFRDYLLPFEVTSVLILVAVIGAIVLTKSPD